MLKDDTKCDLKRRLISFFSQQNFYKAFSCITNEYGETIRTTYGTI